jgi:hypothetical protein
MQLCTLQLSQEAILSCHMVVMLMMVVTLIRLRQVPLWTEAVEAHKQQAARSRAVQAALGAGAPPGSTLLPQRSASSANAAAGLSFDVEVRACVRVSG